MPRSAHTFRQQDLFFFFFLKRESGVRVFTSVILVWWLKCWGRCVGAYRDQGAVAALLSRRAAAAAATAAASSSSSVGALRASLRRLLAPSLRLSVFVGALGFGLQAALVQGESLLPLEFEALHGRVVVAALAAVVMPPEELDATPEPLHHRAVPRHHIIRHADQSTRLYKKKQLSLQISLPPFFPPLLFHFNFYFIIIYFISLQNTLLNCLHFSQYLPTSALVTQQQKETRHSSAIHR